MRDDEDYDAVFSIGKVISVQGRRIRIAVDKLKNSPHLLYKGKLVRNVAVGSFVKITKGFVELVASVDGEYIKHIKENPGSSLDYRRSVDSMIRELEVNLIGYFEGGKFHRGVREMPLLDNECFILDKDEFDLVHAFLANSDSFIPLGVLSAEPSQKVSVGVDQIFASHIGIFGNTGSGKSHTLAKLYHELFEKFGDKSGFLDNSKFILIDFNGEYMDPDTVDSDSSSVIVGSKHKTQYRLSTQKNLVGNMLPLPKSVLHDNVFWSILLDATEKTQAPFIARTLSSDFLEDLLSDSSEMLEAIRKLITRATMSTNPSMDRTLPINFLEEIKECLADQAEESFKDMIEDFRGNLNYHTGNHSFCWGIPGSRTEIYAKDNTGWGTHISGKMAGVTQDFRSVSNPVDLVRLKLVFQYYFDVIAGFANPEHIGPLMKRLNNKINSLKQLITEGDAFVAPNPLTVISLRDVNLDMRKVLPMILCRYLYEEKKVNDPLNERHLNIIIDEAHNILSSSSARESEASHDYRLETFEEIIKEGRKFGVFLTIASQRPHDISQTIISQLHNYFLHRLVNDLDIKAIEKAVSYIDRVSFESMPILPTGTCILSGVAAEVPVVVNVEKLDSKFAPNSKTLSLSELWNPKNNNHP